MKNLYQETFQEIRASSRLRTEVQNITKMARRNRWLPIPALTAAVLVVILAGTAVADYLGVHMEMVGDVFNDGSLYYQTQADVTLIPLESLPEELRADSGGKDRMFGFNSLSEVGEYLGVQLLDNPKLDQLEPYKQPILFNGEAAVKEPYLLMVHGDPAQVLDLHANYLLIERRPDPGAQYGGEEDYFVQFRAFLYTDAADFQEAERDPRGFYINTKGSAQVEEYVTPNGLVSAIITETGVNWPDRDYVQQVAYFATDYAYFSLTIYYYNDGKAETARTMLMELLDAFK